MSMITTVAKCKQSHVCVIADFDDKKNESRFSLKSRYVSDFCVNSGNQRANSIDKSIPQAYGGLTKNNI